MDLSHLSVRFTPGSLGGGNLSWPRYDGKRGGKRRRRGTCLGLVMPVRGERERGETLGLGMPLRGEGRPMYGRRCTTGGVPSLFHIEEFSTVCLRSPGPPGPPKPEL